MAVAPEKMNTVIQICVLFCGNCCPTFNIGRNVSCVPVYCITMQVLTPRRQYAWV